MAKTSTLEGCASGFRRISSGDGRCPSGSIADSCTATNDVHAAAIDRSCTICAARGRSGSSVTADKPVRVKAAGSGAWGAGRPIPPAKVESAALVLQPRPAGHNPQAAAGRDREISPRRGRKLLSPIGAGGCV
jgi:hypothetical protein